MMWLTLSAAILFEVLATLSLRASRGFTEKSWLVPAVAGYAGAFALLWFTLSKGMPVGIAYGIWTACGVVLVAIVARVLFAEPLTKRMLLGIALITVGVLAIDMTGAGPH